MKRIQQLHEIVYGACKGTVIIGYTKMGEAPGAYWLSNSDPHEGYFGDDFATLLYAMNLKPKNLVVTPPKVEESAGDQL